MHASLPGAVTHHTLVTLLVLLAQAAHEHTALGVDDHVVGPHHPERGQVEHRLGGPGRDAYQRIVVAAHDVHGASGANPIPDGRVRSHDVRSGRRRVAEHFVPEHVREPQGAVVPAEAFHVGKAGDCDLGVAGHVATQGCRGRTGPGGGPCTRHGRR